METKTATVIQDLGNAASNLGTTASQAAAAAGQRAVEVAEKIQDKGSEILQETQKTASEAYDKTSRAVSANYQQALDFGRANPGTTSLIALGAGIGLGILLANRYSPRSRVSRIVPPVMNALTTLAYGLLRR